MSVVSKNIAIFPLQWGLGHAGRMIPFALRLRNMGHNVFIASSDEHISFFRRETEGLNFIKSSSFSIRYSALLPQWLVILVNSPRLLWYTCREHSELKRIITDYKLDIVISDSRPGLWNKTVRTAFVSHIPGIPLPWYLFPVKFAGFLAARFILKRYDMFIIPDMPGSNNFAGSLSHPSRLPENARYCGILSRFKPGPESSARIPGNYILAILSGPEPQKSIFRDKIIKLSARLKRELVILGAQPGEFAESYDSVSRIRYFSHAATDVMAGLITNAGVIITRSGYTSVMELASLRRSAIVVPTPGQSEQEYLAVYLEKKGWFRRVLQKNLDLIDDLTVPENKWPVELFEESERLTEICLQELLQQ